jgi:hypothetical protein
VIVRNVPLCKGRNYDKFRFRAALMAAIFQAGVGNMAGPI